MEACNTNYTIGTDVSLDVKSEYEKLGGEVAWNTNLAMLDLERIVSKPAELAAQPDISVNLFAAKT